MNYLFQLGHRRIGMIAGSTWVRTARDVVDTYDRKLREMGIEPPLSWREDGLFTEEGGAAATRQLLERHPDLTAILAGNDKMAIGAIHYLSATGKRVPNDVSVVGFDDMQQAAFANPALTTVHLPLYQVGVLACEKLIARELVVAESSQAKSRPTLRIKPSARTYQVENEMVHVSLPPYGSVILASPE
jgi:LacI family transcriptional regulator